LLILLSIILHLPETAYLSILRMLNLMYKRIFREMLFELQIVELTPSLS